MNFFEKIRSMVWAEKKEVAMAVAFLFRGNAYILDEFDIDFRQDTDDKNQPNSETYGGLITITTSDVPDEFLTAWMMNLHETRDGEIRFIPNADKMEEGTALYVSFKDAYCISYQKVIHPSGVGTQTTLIISPRYVKIGGEEFENKWKT